MPRFRLSKAADQDLTDIYQFTFREFGEKQADAYFHSLEESIQRIAENPKLGLDVSSIREGYRRLSHQSHAIYYRQTTRGILIVRVLGPGMSAERQLL